MLENLESLVEHTVYFWEESEKLNLGVLYYTTYKVSLHLQINWQKYVNYYYINSTIIFDTHPMDYNLRQIYSPIVSVQLTIERILTKNRFVESPFKQCMSANQL